MIRFVVVFVFLNAVSGGPYLHDKHIREEYIVGGRPTNIREVPYQIGLVLNGHFICGGSILSATHILTAAHCVVDCSNVNGSYSIRAGSSNKTAGGVLIPAKNVEYHPKFSLETLDFDIAVVELAWPLRFDQDIRVIKIGEKVPADNEPVKVSGWGCLKENGTRPTQLQSVVVPMVNRKTCEKNYKDYMEITGRMICAGVEGKDSCQGDSGGPLAYRDTLVGVVSFGKGCARKDCPGVYTNLAHPDMRTFIRQFAKV